MARVHKLFTVLIVVVCAACRDAPRGADLILVGARVYTLSWPDPDAEGRPDSRAPYDSEGWRPDADAIVVDDGRIVLAGSAAEALMRRGTSTEVLDLKGATVVPGLIDSHVHLANLGASLDRVDLVGVETEADVVNRIAARAAQVPKGSWVVGWGWDEGAWTTRLPTMELLSARVPDHPVILHGLHTFAVWGNRLAFERAGITAATKSPTGGEIRKDSRGNPTGILLNNATSLLTSAVPPPARAELESRVRRALDTMVSAGFSSVHEAGADRPLLDALEALDSRAELAMPVYAMLAARDASLIDEWRSRTPRALSGRLAIRGVKAFYDGAMGSRGAFFLAPYGDRPGHSGTGGAAYGFDRDRMTGMMKAGYQVTIHAIGDRANREALDFFEGVIGDSPSARDTRPRIEHAQVLSAQDIRRFASLGVIASMQPSHAVEDMPWAEARIGPDRLKGAYAWRSLRRAGARLVFNSDLPATDYNIFYGLHSAVTRQDRVGEPPGGWRKEEALTIEEAIRGWTTWAAFAEFREDDLGAISSGRRANFTVLDIDPFTTAARNPSLLLKGTVTMTIIDGIVHRPR